VRLGIPEVLGFRADDEAQIKRNLAGAALRLSQCGVSVSLRIVVGNSDSSLFGDEVDVFVTVRDITANDCLQEWLRTRGPNLMRMVVVRLTETIAGSSVTFGNQVEVDPDVSDNVENLPKWIKDLFVFGGAILAGLVVLNRVLK